MAVSKQGSLLQADFFDNTGGINLSASPFQVGDNQATYGAYNYNILTTGAITKRRGHMNINSSALSNLQSLGLGSYISGGSPDTRFVVRAAGRNLENFNTTSGSSTALTDDTAAASINILAAGSTQPVCFTQFNQEPNNILWAAGGGMTLPYGVTSTTQVTQNGVASPAGSISAAVNTHNGGVFIAAGNLYYAVQFRKKSTQALSNATLDVLATTVNTDDTVTLTLYHNAAKITPLDRTLYDQIWVYRSGLNGVSGFTTGDLIAQIAIPAGTGDITFVDTGTFILTAQNVPRPGNDVIDNSLLPAGTYNSMTMWKRRLVVASGNTLYLSDTDKPESWPTLNFINVPSAGNITALGVVGFTSFYGTVIDEILVVLKEREMWIVTGTALSDFALKFIDNSGCSAQNSVVNANGFIAWMGYRGVYVWDGMSKPIYCSRPIENLFQRDGDLDKTQLPNACAVFYQKNNEIIWFLSHRTYGTQQLQLKLDLRFTIPNAQSDMSARLINGVFTQDVTNCAVYAATNFLPSTTRDETIYFGCNQGFIYQGWIQTNDAGSAYNFRYVTKAQNMGNPQLYKRFQYVVAWVEDVGNWNLNLDYWTDYNNGNLNYSTSTEQVSLRDSAISALWDVAYWDEASWDDYLPVLRPITFQLASDANNNTDGTSIRLQFRQDGADQPVTIYGYSIIYSELGYRRTL